VKNVLCPGHNVWNFGEIYAGGRHLATYANSTTYFYHGDWLNTKRVMTGMNGLAALTCIGFPFGDGVSCTGTNPSNNSFTDDIHDSETNLEHTLFRKYSGTQGRWLTPDPGGVRVVDSANPQTWNRYAYVTNNAPNKLDPIGLTDSGSSTSVGLCQFDINCNWEGYGMSVATFMSQYGLCQISDPECGLFAHFTMSAEMTAGETRYQASLNGDDGTGNDAKGDDAGSDGLSWKQFVLFADSNESEACKQLRGAAQEAQAELDGGAPTKHPFFETKTPDAYTRGYTRGLLAGHAAAALVGCALGGIAAAGVAGPEAIPVGCGGGIVGELINPEIHIPILGLALFEAHRERNEARKAASKAWDRYHAACR
jgi:RHS repeat-associated protein